MNDTVIATAILDRLLHHAHIINIRGDSYRLKSRIKGGVKVVPPADILELDNMAWVFKQKPAIEDRRLGQFLTGDSVKNSPALTLL